MNKNDAARISGPNWCRRKGIENLLDRRLHSVAWIGPDREPKVIALAVVIIYPVSRRNQSYTLPKALFLAEASRVQ